jgi:flagellar M-ring protein FliF
MEPLFKQLHELPRRFAALPVAGRRLLIALVVVLLVVAGVVVAVSNGEGYEYAFTNLTTEDSAEAAAMLKAAKIPFRLEASGAALAVPAGQVYEARMLLATAGLPRGGGVGFELFDRGDLGVSEFTQRVNLRRATEGDLARTISHLSQVRSARVHLTIPEKGVFRDEERKGSASVVLTLQPGRTLGDRELAGIRHLVASAVPGLSPEAVTIVDGKGAVLAAEKSWNEAAQGYAHDLERDLEGRLVGLLEPAVGAGAVVARVTASVDASEIDAQKEAFDGDGAVLRSEHKVNQSQSQDSTAHGGVAGAAANQPLAVLGSAPTPSGSRGSSGLEDETRNWDVGKTVTKTLTRAPRLTRLSVAILIDGVDGKPRSAEEIAQLRELAKKAVGFDTARGDQLEISSAAFTRSAQPPAPPADVVSFAASHPWWLGGGGALLLALLAAAVLLLRGRRAPAPPVEILRPGAKVGDLMSGRTLEPVDRLSEPAREQNVPVQVRARELATRDPERAAHLLRAWIAVDGQSQPEAKP